MTIDVDVVRVIKRSDKHGGLFPADLGTEVVIRMAELGLVEDYDTGLKSITRWTRLTESGKRLKEEFRDAATSQ